MTDTPILTAAQALEAAAHTVNRKLVGNPAYDAARKTAIDAIRTLAARIPPLDGEVARAIQVLRPRGYEPEADLLEAQARELAAVKAELNGRTFTVDEGREWQARAEAAERAVAGARGAALREAAAALRQVADEWSCGHDAMHCDCARDIDQWRFAEDEILALIPTPASPEAEVAWAARLLLDAWSNHQIGEVGGPFLQQLRAIAGGQK